MEHGIIFVSKRVFFGGAPEKWCFPFFWLGDLLRVPKSAEFIAREVGLRSDEHDDDGDDHDDGDDDDDDDDFSMSFSIHLNFGH